LASNGHQGLLSLSDGIEADMGESVLHRWQRRE